MTQEDGTKEYQQRVARQSITTMLRSMRKKLHRELDDVDGSSNQRDLDELLIEQITVIDVLMASLSVADQRKPKEFNYSFRRGFELGVEAAKKKIASNLGRCYDSGVAQIVLASNITLDG